MGEGCLEEVRRRFFLVRVGGVGGGNSGGERWRRRGGKRRGGRVGIGRDLGGEREEERVGGEGRWGGEVGGWRGGRGGGGGEGVGRGRGRFFNLGLERPAPPLLQKRSSAWGANFGGEGKEGKIRVKSDHGKHLCVSVVEWLIILKEQLLLEGLTLTIFFVDFRRLKCVSVSRPMKIVTFLRKKKR